MYFNTHNLSAMSHESIQRKAPAVFATEPHERTSDRYLFIPTIQLIQGLEDNGWDVVSAVQSRGESGHSKHAVMLTRRDFLKSELGVNDIAPMLKIENSHNGLSSFKLSGAIYRKVCANGLTVPESMFDTPKVKHTKNMTGDTIEASFRVLNDFPELVERINQLKRVELSQDEKLVLASSAARLVYDEERIARTNEYYRDEHFVAKSLMKARRYADHTMNDLWTVSNCIQENAVRGGVKLVGESKAIRSRAVQNIDRDSKINQEILTLAQEMAKLKGVAA